MPCHSDARRNRASIAHESLGDSRFPTPDPSWRWNDKCGFLAFCENWDLRKNKPSVRTKQPAHRGVSPDIFVAQTHTSQTKRGVALTSFPRLPRLPKMSGLRPCTKGLAPVLRRCQGYAPEQSSARSFCVSPKNVKQSLYLKRIRVSKIAQVILMDKRRKSQEKRAIQARQTLFCPVVCQKPIANY